MKRPCRKAKKPRDTLRELHRLHIDLLKAKWKRDLEATLAMDRQVRADLDGFFTENPEIVAAWRESLGEVRA